MRGERRFFAEDKEENFQRIERRYGSFTRTFNLPQTLDTNSIAATAENGVLSIDLPKKADAKPKQIKVAVSAPAQTADGQAAAASNN